MDFLDELREELEIDSLHGEDFFPHRYVDNDPFRPREEIVEEYSPTEEYLERKRKREIETLRRRTDNFTNGVNIMENVQNIDIELMTSPPNNWNYLPPPNRNQLLALITSIENIGLINPIILLKESENLYTIIEGRSRVLALRYLYDKDPLDKYKYPVCCILDRNKVDEYYIRSLMIDLNFNYRSLPQNVFIKMFFERYEILKKSKNYRNDANVAEELAKEFSMSTSSVYNYLALRDLSDEVMTLVLDKRMNLQIARLFAKLDKNVQVMILENIDFKDLNCYHKIKYITGGGKTLEDIKEAVKKAEDLAPSKARFTVELDRSLVWKFSEQLVELMKYAMGKLMVNYGTDNVRQYCKINFDEKQLQYLAAKNYIDEITIEKLNARKLSEVFRK